MPPLEWTCLRWIARGKTIAETARLQGMSVTEVELCLEHALGLLEAESVEEAIEKTNSSHSDRN